MSVFYYLINPDKKEIFELWKNFSYEGLSVFRLPTNKKVELAPDTKEFLRAFIINDKELLSLSIKKHFDSVQYDIENFEEFVNERSDRIIAFCNEKIVYMSSDVEDSIITLKRDFGYKETGSVYD